MRNKGIAILLALSMMLTPTVSALGEEETEQAEVVVEPTKAPEPDPEPTAAPSQEPVQEEQAEPEETAPAQEAEPSEEPAEESTEESTDEPTEASTEAPTEEVVGETTEEPTAESTEAIAEEPTAEPTEEVAVVEELAVKFQSASLYGVANSKRIFASAVVSGGVAPYTVDIEIKVGGWVCHSKTQTLEQAGTVSTGCLPSQYGEHTVTFSVVDAEGTTVSAHREIPVAIVSRENAYQWKASVSGAKRTGDWAEDLVAVARTQLGYHEDEKNFIVDNDGVRHCYSRYGAWYRASYTEWCGAFVSFCLNYAGIRDWQFPQRANHALWRKDLQSLGLYEEEEREYEPKPGDLIFFNYEEKQTPQHVGIVERVSKTAVTIIDGNVGGKVSRHYFARDDERIVGYGNMEQAMIDAGKLDIEDYAEVSSVAEGQQAVTNEEGAHVRIAASSKSASVTTIEAAGTAVDVLLCADVGDGEIWYQIQLGEQSGYIRGDLLTLTEP